MAVDPGGIETFELGRHERHQVPGIARGAADPGADAVEAAVAPVDREVEAPRAQMLGCEPAAQIVEQAFEGGRQIRGLRHGLGEGEAGDEGGDRPFGRDRLLDDAQRLVDTAADDVR